MKIGERSRAALENRIRVSVGSSCDEPQVRLTLGRHPSQLSTSRARQGGTRLSRAPGHQALAEDTSGGRRAFRGASLEAAPGGKTGAKRRAEGGRG